MKLRILRNKEQAPSISDRELAAWVQKTMPMNWNSNYANDIIGWQVRRLKNMGNHNTVAYIIQLEKILQEGMLQQFEPEYFKSKIIKQFSLIYYSFLKTKRTKFEITREKESIDRAFGALKNNPTHFQEMVFDELKPLIYGLAATMSIRAKNEGCFMDFLSYLNRQSIHLNYQ